MMLRRRACSTRPPAHRRARRHRLPGRGAGVVRPRYRRRRYRICGRLGVVGNEFGRGVRARAPDRSKTMTMATSAVLGEDRTSRRILLFSLALNLFFVGATGALVARHYFAERAVTAAPLDRTVAARI